MPRYAETCFKAALARRFHPGVAAFGRTWGVAVGSSGSPDYVNPELRHEEYSGGQMMTPDEAEAYGKQLMAVAAWARAQNRLEEVTTCP